MGLRRDGDRLVVADDTNELVEGVAVAEWSLALGDAADAMVAGDVLPGTAEVLDTLSAVDAPAAMPPLGEARTIRLAASCSATAATSSRLDLYPRRMLAERAVSLARSVLVTSGSLSVEGTVILAGDGTSRTAISGGASDAAKDGICPLAARSG